MNITRKVSGAINMFLFPMSNNRVFHESEILFVKSSDDNEFPLDFRHPIMSQA